MWWVNLLAWLTGSKAGRYAALAALGALIGGIVFWKLSAAKADRRAREAAERALHKTKEVLDAVRRMDAAGARSPRSRRELFERLRAGAA
jgi:hypothetical protein